MVCKLNNIRYFIVPFQQKLYVFGHIFKLNIHIYHSVCDMFYLSLVKMFSEYDLSFTSGIIMGIPTKAFSSFVYEEKLHPNKPCMHTAHVTCK